jgi:hypothetical protein
MTHRLTLLAFAAAMVLVAAVVLGMGRQAAGPVNALHPSAPLRP